MIIDLRGKYSAPTMPLAQDKLSECNITNNNDQNYLHKKFKKMASTISISTTNYSKENEVNCKDLDVAQTTNSSISNGSISAAHPEIEKIKKPWLDNLQLDKDVQIKFSNYINRLGEININNSGQTSNSEEFSSKTDNHENDFTKDVQTYGPSGRYVCPYCKLSCAKPSVLQKHIRAHTNERPYPCVPCGFAFKTKSNLYKHRRSRTHALRLQGTDVSAPTHDEESSAESESDNSLPPASASDTWLDTANTRLEMSRPNEFSSPELGLDRVTPPVGSKYDNKGKTLYKPKFRAALYQESDDRQKKPFSPNADFLNEHISKIISNNEAIVDVIETPLQKKYGKIKQIAESKQLSEQFELKSELGPLNLTKSSGETDNGFRKRSHSESFSQHNQKHPLNPEGSIIKDLLLKTKASNGVTAVPTEIVDGSGPLYICPLCQIPYRSVDNLEIHRTYYCKGNLNNVQIAYLKEVKAVKPEDVYVRSNSIHSKMPERSYSPDVIVRMRSSPLRINKPNDIVIVKPENNEVLAPLPSPGPLLGNTRLVDSRLPLEYSNKSEQYKVKPMQSPKRKIDSRSDTYSPRQIDSPSPRLIDMYAHSKIRCLEQSPATLRSFDDFSNNRHNSASLQMFGGEVKIVDYSGGTTTLRIEPSKCQLSPILIQEHMSPSKQGGDAEASSVVVRSGLHSGGTIVHNLPTPKDTMSNSQPRISTASHLHKHLHENTHFQFPPLSAITAFNPLTLPPLSPSVSPNGASTILHAGKFIPHVPGMPGPNTPAIYLSTSVATKISNFDVSRSNNETMKEVISASYSQSNSPQNISVQKSLNLKPAHHEVEKALSLSYNSNIPTIKVKNVDEPVKTPVKVVWTNTVKSSYRSDGLSKKNVECLMKTPVSKEVGNSINTNQKNVERLKVSKNSEEVSNYNFENLITKAEIYNNQIPSSSDVQKNTNAQDCTKTSVHNERSETLYFQKNNTTKSEERKPKFLRPSTLPLKPGTFTPKRHHGITPNANTMPLVSPETPRPAKAYGQLYLNGNAYTYLGLKCSTKVFYCTINRPQPTYVPNQHFLSMYSNWQLLSELTPDPLGLTAATAMSLYDSRHRPQSLTIAMIKQELILTHSSQWKKLSNDHKPMIMAMDSQRADELRHNSDHTITPKKEVTGGFESNEEYTYIRGRGRGRYVCSECGIRCKKPSMLKKHIRTHTDVRPYTCVRCSFSFKTKGNLTKHMKSKAHYKKCCELGINPNEGNENGELNQGLGETDEETDSDGDEGNEGETESSDTETCKSRLPEHEAAHCLLSLGCSRPTTSRTPGLITSARPTTYPYNPTGQDGQTSEHSQQPLDSPHVQNQPNEQNKMDVDNEPMDLSRNEIKCNITEIPTARESSVLASLASNTAKLPQHQNQWSNGEPMLHAYLTERALQDSKIKQSQLTSSLSKIRKNELEKAVCQDKSNVMAISNSYSSNNMVNTVNTLTISMSSRESPKIDIANIKKISINNETSKTINALMVDTESKSRATQACDNATNTENAKFVVSEYLRHAKVNVINDKSHTLKDGFSDLHKDMEEYDKLDDNNSETESIKLPVMEHDLVAQKVVIGAGGVAFKVSTKGKDFDSSSSYNPGKLMEDGRRVCDFCNKTFTKPSQLRLHLNIHYMERPFRCSACAVSFRTRGHLQKHERSGSHHNKVSMTSTFGAATSLNPRPFRCSDCNIAFRIHGHLAKHLRSKMHVMRLECLFKLPFGTFTEIERAGVSLTDIDTTDCASSLASLQVLAQKLHEKDPSKLEYRDPSSITVTTPPGRESSEDEDGMSTEKFSESEKDSEMRTKGSDSSNIINAPTMPLAQDKLSECNITNNNDQNYLHKKFKKMASTISISTTNYSKENEVNCKDLDVAQTTNSSISNGSISAAHPEIEKIKKPWLDNLQLDKDVQIKFSNYINRLGEININNSGQTSNSEEFSSKTDNHENDFTKDVQTYGPSGRYVCPYCKLSCAKPSVLQKHIRAHTNERPYPCVPCGFAFKTKSNLYKHRRSRTHALRLQGTDVSAPTHDEESSAESESDNSLPPASASDTWLDTANTRLEMSRPNEFSSPELGLDRVTPPVGSKYDNKGKTLYKPKFRAALYQESDDRQKKPFSPNADFLNEHISKIISNNEAIVDVIETPLQKKYGKIKQIAESKQLSEQFELKSELGPLNLTKSSGETDNGFRKRSHSESFSQHNQKHPLNPEGSIIKDLLLKTKASNGVTAVPTEIVDGSGPLYICPLCQIPYRSVDNLEIHRTYYCKGNLNNVQIAYLKEVKAVKPEDVYVRSNSIHSKMPERSYSPDVIVRMRSSPLRINKPNDIVIVKPENNEVLAPLPSPGPLLGNTRLVDSRLPLEYSNKSEQYKVKPMQSPKRKIDSRSDTYSPRQIDSPSPRLIDMYAHSKIRCLEQSPATLRSFDDFSNNRHNSASLQMFGGEVKIVDYSGGTTTLRIEPSKCQLSPILIQEHMSPSKQGGDAEASSVVVRSGLHSGGTIVHNLPTPKDTMSNSQPRISTASHLHKHLHENTHFQFPPLSAITAFNPLTLPPLSPSVSPNGASTILHAGKFIPHVPGMPGPNTPAIYLSTSVATKISNFDVSRSNNETMKEVISASYSQSNSPQNISVQKSLNLKPAHHEVEKALSLSYNSNIPTIKVKNVDEPVKTPVKVVWTNTVKSSYRSDGLSKKNVECLMKTPVSKEVGNSINTNQKNVERLKVSKNSEEVSNYNFENLITKAEIYNNQIPSSSDVQKNTNAQDCTKTSVHNERSETLYFQKNNTTKSEERKPKFLRPSTLPLKPGTFTPKRHHGITPNANTMPLVSPETPRPAKAYGQLYLNGNAYTYLGLKCSTKVFYCTINRPQPTYVPNQHFLSMYSNWQLLSELTPDPLGLTAATAMSLYDSRHRPQSLTIAMIKQELILTHSSQWKKLSNDHKPMIMAMDSQRADELRHNSDHTITPKKEVTGGFESNEEYTYIRGRGRGRYVCSECGIRCKKPSMLKKHIRTHTDVRPYTCVRCSFSFKTKGNLTKHMKSKAHYKKCCELGINPNEGNENGELNQGLGETDEETDSDGDEGNEGETESSDTETCKSRLPEHEAAHCLLSLGCSRPTTSRTPGLITSARPTTYPYNPTGQDGQTSEHSQQPLDSPHVQNQPNEQNKMDVDNEPMDLSRNEIKCNITEIPTARESSVLASLASNTAKLPQHQNQWSNGEPMLHAYLTERALQDSKIKQSQLTSSLSKIRKNELEKAVCQDKSNVMAISNSYSSNNMVNTVNTLTISMSSRESPKIDIANIKKISINNETSKTINALMVDTESKSRATQACDNATNTENAKFVVSEYLRHAKVNVINDKSHTLKDGFSDLHKDMEEYDKLDDNNSETESIKLPVMEHDLVAQKVVIGAGGVAFKVSTKGKDFDSSSSYNPGKLMEDGRRVCDFCNKTFTKPSQLRLHLNIHYMERPFRCSACAVSFRTRGHLQKHERSGSHHNKVSMTSTFGAATSLNPRPFRCSDCNIAFRIHGHLAKHLRSKMHVMRLECLFKLPFGTFTEIERAGVSLTDIDTTDCASSLASLQVLAQKLHEKDPSKLEYRDPSSITVTTPPGRESSEDEDGMSTEKFSESEKDSEMRTKGSDSSNIINAPTMPLAQDKLSECNITNNNDQNYLHKKFKKMASTISISTTNYSKENEVNCKDLDVAQTTNSSISNGSISAAHPEIEKIKKPWLDNLQLDKDVQIKFSNYINRLGEININNSGQTSNSEEFSSKTDNHENDFTKDVQTYGPSGRYVCPYCKLSCAKPSVLQKHIRAHTNERPYPCVPCGFAFKTKSNLYKHRRSRTHALRLQGTDVSAPTHDEESSAESESDNSLPPASASDTWLDTANTRLEMSRPNEFSSPELGLDRVTPPVGSKYDNKGKTLYKPKFRAALYQESDDRQKKPFSPNADFLNEHISKIISNNEAIVDVIETPLQKKYGKIKQIAESKQLSEQFELKSELGPLNLTKSSGETDNGFRKRSHSESFSQHNQKHPLNPEGSIIKDLLLKTKASNGVTAVPTEIVDGSGPLYICPLCQIPYRSVDNLEIHRTYYCKGNLNNVQIAYLKEVKAVKPEDVYVRSNSIHSKMPERSYSPDVIVRMRSSPLRINKPNDIVIVKPENNEVLAPLPSPGPLLGNTRLVDSRLPLEYSNKSEQYKVKPMQSPKRKIDSRSDTYSPRQIDSPSPRLIDMYAHSKIRCLEQSPATLRSFDDFSNNRHNSASLQMFGGEVKIVDYSGGTTTLRIEPSKCQLSPILIQEHMSPSKQGGDAEASSVVVRSGLHSGGTIVHNLPTPKDTMSNSQPRISTASHLHKHLHENTHFQFPPLSAITAFNPLTLPPLSPSVSPNGASTILHAGKFIPHVPGMPGPNTPAIYLSTSVATKISNFDVSRSNNETMKEVISASYSQSNSPQNISVQKSLNLKPAHHEVEKALSLSYNSNIPTIKVKNVDEPVKTPVKVVWTNTVKSSYRSDGLSKKNVECLMKTPVSKEVGNSINTNQKNVERLKVSKNSEEVSNYNFENLITKAEIYNNQIPSSSDVQKNTNAQDCTKTSVHNERSETLYFQKNNTTKSEERKPKFLRPSTLPLKPGTFTPKRHHGITPNANTMPLVSPETPRPAKAYGQLYLNGNAYTYLGLKCSTKVFYCTINRPQPTYVPNQHFLSMYSNWQLLSELTPDPLGLTAATAMSLYDSRHRPQSLTIAMIKQELILTHSSQWKKLSNDHKPMIMAMDSQRADELRHNSDHTITPKKEVTGGFESNEEYTYIRGRGRGRYVCSECGIRCKKPSMLKKHIRTHTDVRPYTCVRCSFSFKTKGNLTKHMKSKAHYKKCCELGINPNEGNENGELNQGLGETDEETDSDGDEGNEGETESSDTETCKSRLPEHEAAHCLLSLGCSRPTTSRTPGLITSARPTTYPYNPTGQDGQTSEHSQQPLDSPHVQNQPNEQNKMDVDNEPMDLSRNEIKCNITEIPTARESSVLASLASNTAKLPQHQNQWSNGEPMLHAYLTERALQDSKIKQSQLTSSLSKIRKNELEKAVCQDKSNVMAISNSYSSNNMVNTVNTLTISMSSRESPKIDIANIKKISINNETSKTINALMVDTESKSRATQACDNATNTENAKFVVSEYLRHAKVNVINDKSHTLKDGFSDLHKDMEEYDKLDDNNSETESIKLPVMEHDLVAQKVVIGAGGVAFKVSTKGKDFDSSSSYNPGKLMEDGRRVCDFCNKTFTKPSQLRLHLNIHYMERPFRCSACAVSFRTRGHLQKHERSGSHHNKVSMTSTFGAATSLNPRPFRCSDCNIAFRIHGHLAKHLRSKMHVMRLECLFKLPFGTFTEIERAGVSLTDIDTTDCASSLASLQVLAQKLHEKDPSKLEYRDPSSITVTTPPGRESSEDEDGMSTEKFSESEKDSEMRTKGSDSSNSRIIYSATDN